jgi:hypothetical protein
MQTFEWAIEEIIEAHPDLYLEHCAAMAVAVMSRHSTSPCEFTVDCEGFIPGLLQGEKQFRLKVLWSEHTAFKAQRVRRTEQSKPIVERAAIALAALLFAKMISDGQMRVTREGERADYWLPRLQRALEISGTHSLREMPRRHKEKVAQVLSNPLRWHGYVVICCFAASRNLIRWSYHEQEAQ